MAVYATMIRDDPDSRARLRVTPEQALNFPNYHCLASWIASGTRIPSFIGQTYPMADVGDQWAEWHLERMLEQVGPYPEELESTLATVEPRRSDEPAGPNGTATEIAPAVEAPGPSTPPTPRTGPRSRPPDGRQARGPGRLRAPAGAPPISPTVPSGASSEGGPSRPTPDEDRPAPEAFASSRSSTASTKSATPTS